jgi:hypothetical protein
MPFALLLTVLMAGPAAFAASGPPAVRDTLSAGASAADSLALRLVPRDTLTLRVPGEAKSVEPDGIAVDPFGRIEVSDAAAHQLHRYDERGTWLGEAGALGNDPGQLRRPVAVAVLGSLGVAVLDRENRRVATYDLFGRLIGILIDLADPALDERVGRIDPIALAADRGAAVVIADADRDRLLAFDFSGQFVREIGGFGTRPGSFHGLAGVAFAPHGELVTTERASARVQWLDAGGRAVSAWPIALGAGQGAVPVAVDDSARVAVADEVRGRVWIFDRSGRPLAAREGFAGPRALAFAPDGALLVAEARAGRVIRLDLVRHDPGRAADGK